MKLAVASKSPNGKELYSNFLKAIPAPNGAGCAGKTLYNCFDIVIIQEGDKVASLTSIRTSTGAKPWHMILFDDDTRNGASAKKAEVVMHLVGVGQKANPELITTQMFEKGLTEWKSNPEVAGSAGTSGGTSSGTSTPRKQSVDSGVQATGKKAAARRSIYRRAEALRRRRMQREFEIKRRHLLMRRMMIEDLLSESEMW
jgi:hypothetical protein